jgi:hypothetical protein
MRWPWQKKPEVPVSAEVAESILNEVVEGARERGAAVEVVTMSGPEAVKFLEQVFGDEEGGLPDDIREFFERGGDRPGDGP